EMVGTLPSYIPASVKTGYNPARDPRYHPEYFQPPWFLKITGISPQSRSNSGLFQPCYSGFHFAETRFSWKSRILASDKSADRNRHSRYPVYFPTTIPNDYPARIKPESALILLKHRYWKRSVQFSL